MKLFQKATTALLASLMLISSMGCGSNTTPASSAAPAGSSTPVTGTDSTKTLRIYGWNTEFQGRFNTYFKNTGKLSEGINMEWAITPNENSAYQNKLGVDLKTQDSAADKVDISLIEADYALKYVDSDYALDVKGDIGLSDNDLKDQYRHIRDIAIDGSDKLRVVFWQATPGSFTYCHSIIKDVLGSSDAAKVQQTSDNWDKFGTTIRTTADKDYKVLSGYDNSHRTFTNSIVSS